MFLGTISELPLYLEEEGQEGEENVAKLISDKVLIKTVTNVINYIVQKSRRRDE